MPEGSAPEGQSDVVVMTCENGGTCAAPAPSGWTGPIVLYAGDSPSPACPASMPQAALDAHGDLQDPGAASCSCACELKGASCKGSYSLSNYAGAGCTPDNCPSGGNPEEFGVCYPFIAGKCSNANPKPVLSWNVTVNATPQGTCSPVEQNPPLTPPSWSSEVRGCGSLSLAPGGCDGGSVCVPAIPPPFAAGACIFRAGDVQCPQGPYAKRTVYYYDFDDTRACSACSCDGPTGGECKGTMTMRAGAGCSGNTLGSGQVPGCVEKPQVSSGYFVVSVSASGATCSPAGGAPTGSVTPIGPTTVCCSQ